MLSDSFFENIYFEVEDLSFDCYVSYRKIRHKISTMKI